MSKIIVTGGAGFIGSHIVDTLVNQNHHVVVIDNLSSPFHEHFYFNSQAEYQQLDIADYDAIRPVFEGVEYVFHLAAESRIQPTIENPLLAFKTNTMGTVNILQASREAGVKRVMYSSTSSSYGSANVPPLVETMYEDCLNPYSVSKVAGEKACKMYYDLFGLETVVFRYFNVYGPREPTKGAYAPVVGLFMRQHKAAEPLTIVGDGEQRRDFTYIDDVVNANMLAMTIDHTQYGTVFNVGTGCNHSVLELAALISNNIQFVPPRLGEARETLADNTKIKTVLGWEPKHSIETYIREQLSRF